MMNESPALMGGSLEHTQKKQALLTEIIAGRMGLDPATDLRPHVVAAATTCAFQAAADATRRRGGGSARSRRRSTRRSPSSRTASTPRRVGAVPVALLCGSGRPGYFGGMALKHPRTAGDGSRDLEVNPVFSREPLTIPGTRCPPASWTRAPPTRSSTTS